MDCTWCQQIEADLQRLEKVYAEKLDILRANVATASTEDYHRLRAAEGNARRDLEFARAELNSHKQNYHQKISGHSSAQ